MNRGDKTYMLTIQTVLGGGGYKTIRKYLNKYGNMFFMDASIFVIRYLNKNKGFVALSIFCDILYITT